MPTPIQDSFAENAASGIKKVVSDGEVVEMHSLDEQRRAADQEAKKEAATGKSRMGIKMFKVRTGGTAPL